jgi:hypothetical protein
MARVWRKSRFYSAGFVMLLFACFTLVANAADCLPPPSDLVSWWPGDGNALDIVSGHDGTLQNGATFAPGMVGQAFNFDGVDDHVSIFNNSSLTAGGAFTIELWAKFNHVPRNSDFTNSMFFLEKNPEYVLYWRPDLNALELDIADDCDGLFHLGAYTHLPTLQAGEFHHIAVTARDAGRGMHPEIHFFFDGVDLGSNPNSNLEGCGWNIAAAELRIGARTNQWGGPMAFNGLLDEVSFYNRVLTPLEIQDIFNADSEGKCKLISITIDIKPGSSSNPVNPHNNGVLEVAILTTTEFDVNEVNATTVRFGATGVEAAPAGSALEDIDGDGDADMLLRFRTQGTGILCGDLFASLTGETISGQPIEGVDGITTVGCP